MVLARPMVAAVAVLSLSMPALAGDTARVGMDKMQFLPKVLKVKPGTTVEWVNDEKRNSHSVLFEKEGLPESERLFPGDSWKRVFDKPGVYPYVCGPHRDMTGVIEVEGK